MSFGKNEPLNLPVCVHKDDYDDDDDDDDGDGACGGSSDGGGNDKVVRHLLTSGSAGVEWRPPPTSAASWPLSCDFASDITICLLLIKITGKVINNLHPL